jgi:cobalamin biosynthesis Mg chelatase CobN
MLRNTERQYTDFPAVGMLHPVLESDSALAPTWHLRVEDGGRTCSVATCFAKLPENRNKYCSEVCAAMAWLINNRRQNEINRNRRQEAKAVRVAKAAEAAKAAKAAKKAAKAAKKAADTQTKRPREQLENTADAKRGRVTLAKVVTITEWDALTPTHKRGRVTLAKVVAITEWDALTPTHQQDVLFRAIRFQEYVASIRSLTAGLYT